MKQEAAGDFSIKHRVRIRIISRCDFEVANFETCPFTLGLLPDLVIF